MHYRERKHWDKIVTPITEEDKAQKRFEYFQEIISWNMFKEGRYGR